MPTVLTPSQAKIVESKSRFRVVCCGRRFGKTTLAVEEIKGWALYREAKIAYLAPTYQQARDIAWEALKRELAGITVQANESRLEIRTRNLKGTESLIALRGWESIETLRGQAFDFIVIDEVAMMRNFWTNWQEVIRPTLTDRKGEVLFLSTPKGFNHFHDLFLLEKNDKDFKSFQFSSYDNPYLAKEEIDKAKEQLSENSFAQEYGADFRKVEGLVYDFGYDYELEMTEEYERYLFNPEKTLAGVDFGYTNPTGILIGKWKDGTLYIVDEWKKDKKTTPEIIEQCKTFDRKHKTQRWYPDPAEPDRIEEMSRAGLFCGEVNKDVEYGISVVSALIKEKKLFVDKRCQNLIDELDQYRYDEGKESPIKENDHLCDALRYMIVGAELTKEDKWKQQYANVPFHDRMKSIWRGDE